MLFRERVGTHTLRHVNGHGRPVPRSYLCSASWSAYCQHQAAPPTRYETRQSYTRQAEGKLRKGKALWTPNGWQHPHDLVDVNIQTLTYRLLRRSRSLVWAWEGLSMLCVRE
jgi:hypothetical protein